MLKVLVAGGAGYIGSHTVHKLVQSGYDVTVIDDLSTGSKLSVPSNVHFHQANLLDIQAVRSVFEKKQFDAVFHFAAKLSVPESFIKFDEYVQTNVMGTFHLPRRDPARLPPRVCPAPPAPLSSPATGRRPPVAG